MSLGGYADPLSRGPLLHSGVTDNLFPAPVNQLSEEERKKADLCLFVFEEESHYVALVGLKCTM